MPINDPVRDRKIAPNSLAFPTGRRSSRNSSTTTTYQQTVEASESTVIVYADSEIQNADRHALATADRDTEHRAKAWVGGWHRVIDWDITDDQVIESNKWDPLRFTNEAMRAMGAFQAPTPKWSWKVPDTWEGTYFIYAFVTINCAILAAVTVAKLGILVNGQLRTLVDQMDIDIAGDSETYIRDVVMRGGRNISVAAGDVVQVAVYLAGAEGNDTYLHPSSVVGYVSGFRTMCGTDHNINTQDDINGYNFS